MEDLVCSSAGAANHAPGSAQKQIVSSAAVAGRRVGTRKDASDAWESRLKARYCPLQFRIGRQAPGVPRVGFASERKGECSPFTLMRGGCLDPTVGSRATSRTGLDFRNRTRKCYV